MRKLIWLLLILLPLAVPAEALPLYPYTIEGKLVAEYTSDTLVWRIERKNVKTVPCFFTKIWMVDPGRQIGKATAEWEVNILHAKTIAKQAPEASLVINGSGYVTKQYPWIPENYPGESEDYYFTPLGSITVTDGEVFRCMEDVPFYGLTLNEDGLHMHVNEEPLEILAQEPTQTWSFFVECPIIQDHQSILDPNWNFTWLKNSRNIICRMDANNYLILTVATGGGGLTMTQCVDFLLAYVNPEWAYNLDGGPSTALLYRGKDGKLVDVNRPRQNNVDIMTFSELPRWAE